MGSLHQRQRGDQEQADVGLAGGDSYGAPGTIAFRLGDGLIHDAHRVACGVEKLLPGLVQSHAATEALEQRHAEILLEQPHRS